MIDLNFAGLSLDASVDRWHLEMYHRLLESKDYWLGPRYLVVCDSDAMSGGQVVTSSDICNTL